MRILVIGNGFDLAHNLPTSYDDFLDFATAIMDMYSKEKDTSEIINVYCNKKNREKRRVLLSDRLRRISLSEKYNEEFINCLNNNFWFEHFKGKYDLAGWVGFENDILAYIKELDNWYINLTDHHKTHYDKIDFDSDTYGPRHVFSKSRKEAELFIKNIGDLTNRLKICTESIALNNIFEKISNKLECELINLIRDLEIYLTYYIEQIKVDLYSRDILNIMPDKVLSFNYTNTFEKVYMNLYNSDHCSRMEIDYIHGKAKLDNSIEDNNIVLGIDEYLNSTRKNTDLLFARFKKYFQRIFKGTGCIYKDWTKDFSL